MGALATSYSGPFVLWGRDDLKQVDLAALQRLDDKVMRNIFSEATAIVLFVRNTTSGALSSENYPGFRQMVQQTQWTYLPQHWLTSDPVDYNVNAEVFFRVFFW